MLARLDRTQGYSGSFDLVLIDGHEDGEFPTNVQVEYSEEQIGLAESLGCELGEDDHDEGRHGRAYEFLKERVGTQFAAPEGYFDGIPYGPFKQCSRCTHFHRLGYGGECGDEGYTWDGNEMRRL